MQASSIGLFSVFFWIAVEIVCYGLVIQFYGIALATLVGVVSLALGIAAFRRLGLRLASLARTDIASRETIFVRVRGLGLAALGALLLVLPGFFSNAVGLALLAFNPKAWIFPKSVPARVDDIVELEPDQWSSGQRDSGKPPERMSVDSKNRRFDG